MGNLLSTYLCPHPPIIVNEIGKGEEGKVQDTVDSLMEIAKDIKAKKPKTIIVITPHGPVFRDAIAIGYNEILKGDLSNFRCKELSIKKKNNLNLVDYIVKKSLAEEIYCVKLNDKNASNYEISTDLDHGVQIPLYFVDKEYKDYKLVHITYGILPSEDLYKFGTLIQMSIEELEEDVSVIASGDLSHKLKEDSPNGYNPAGPKFDAYLMELIKENKFEDIIAIDKALAEEAGECGLRSIQIMLGILDGHKVKSEVLSYEGTFGVGYGVAKFEPRQKDGDRELINKIYNNVIDKINKIRNKEDYYVKLARKSLESFVKEKKEINITEDIPEELINNRAGVFVSIKKDGDLRGCIGTTEPTTGSIAKEIIRNAINAGTQDPRFHPVEENELDKLVYSVDVLGESEVVKSFEELDENKYGVIVSSRGRRGLLLPNLKGVNSVKEQVNIALEKANISPKEDYKIERFRVVRHSV